MNPPGGQGNEGGVVVEGDEGALDPADVPDLEGVTLPGGWQVVRHLAVGSMGHVYEARHTEDGPSSAAIKVLHTSLAGQSDIAFRFRREADILEAIESPHVPRLFDRGREGRGRPFFVMEFLNGPEISRLLREHRVLPTRLSLEIARQLCLALGAAHRAGITHRDLKPDNVMVCGSLSSPDVKLFDFSVSKSGDIALTQPGTILGTASYMSPEQARGAPVSVQFDVYAVGAVLYEMLTGRPPFGDLDTRKTLVALLTEDAPRPRTLEPGIPEGVERVVLRAIAKDPGQRYRSVEELERAVAEQLSPSSQAPGDEGDEEDPPVTIRKPSPASQPAPPSSRRLRAPPSSSRLRAARSDVTLWAVGGAMLGAAAVVLSSALTVTGLVPLWLVAPASGLGLGGGWWIGRRLGR